MFEFKKTGQRQKQRFRLRVWCGAIFAVVFLSLLGSRLWYLQVDRYEGFSERADRNRITVLPIPPRRGEITDRNGEVLARNYRTYTLEVVPAHAGNVDEMFDRLRQLVYVSAADQRRFKRRVNESSRYASLVLRNNLNDTEAAWFAAHAFLFPGVDLRARWVREYPQGEVAAHVVGFTGRIAESDVDALDAAGILGNYRGTDVIGKKGIEKTWESTLHGTTGLDEVEVNASGRPTRSLRRIDPIPGEDVRLSIDLNLQRIAEAAFDGRRGALVAIEPDTGEVLAFVSQPSFNPNLFVDGIDVENWRLLNESPDHPLINRPLYGTYPIGSTYKPFVALAALELGKRDAAQRFPDPGFYEFGGQRFRNAGSVAYGMTDMHKAIVVSSDTYFYSLGPEIGVNGLHDFMKPFSFGQLTGIDLDGERAGVLPSTEWKRKAYKERDQQRWYTGETISVAVGQGYNSFTLLQLAQATSTLANNGTYRKPHLVHATVDGRDDSRQKEIDAGGYQIPLQQSNVDRVKHAMVDVIKVGTARRSFAGAPYQAAGKTGTAQVYSLRGAKYRADKIDERLRDHALFMGFAPAENPKIAVALIVENGGWGATAAAPVARKVFDYWLVERPAQAALQTAAAVKQLTESAAIVPSLADATTPQAAGTGTDSGTGASLKPGGSARVSASGGAPVRVPADAFRQPASGVTVRGGGSASSPAVTTSRVPTP